MDIVKMETIMLVAPMMEVIAALVLIHHMDGILTALSVNVKKMVITEDCGGGQNVDYSLLTLIAMMNIIMQIVTMIVVRAAIIQKVRHMLTALFVNVLNVNMPRHGIIYF